MSINTEAPGPADVVQPEKEKHNSPVNPMKNDPINDPNRTYPQPEPTKQYPTPNK